jgi:hypothetical protein
MERGVLVHSWYAVSYLTNVFLQVQSARVLGANSYSNPGYMDQSIIGETLHH